jgi:hypothetical protein
LGSLAVSYTVVENSAHDVITSVGAQVAHLDLEFQMAEVKFKDGWPDPTKLDSYPAWVNGRLVPTPDIPGVSAAKALGPPLTVIYGDGHEIDPSSVRWALSPDNNLERALTVAPAQAAPAGSSTAQAWRIDGPAAPVTPPLRATPSGTTDDK